MRAFLKGLLVFAAGVLLGFVLLFMVTAIPASQAAKHVRSSGDILIHEEVTQMLIEGDPTSRLDNFTDSIKLLSCAYEGPESILEQTLFNYRTYVKGVSKAESCQLSGQTEGRKTKRAEYSWYWLGFKVVLKPLLCFFDLGQLRIMNRFGIAAALLLIIILLAKKKRILYAVPFLAAMIFSNLYAISCSLQYSTIFYLTIFTSAVLLLFEGKAWFGKNDWVFFMIFGMMTSYFDFLTYPIWTLAFPLAFYLICQKDVQRLGTCFLRCVKLCVLWCVGYVGMWTSKWIITSVLTGENHISKGLDKVLERTGSQVGDKVFSEMDMLRLMSEYLHASWLKIFVVGFTVIVIVLIILTKGYRRYAAKVTAAAMLVISLFPLMWYTFARNHSCQHSPFTFRTMAVGLFAACSMLLILIDEKKLHKKHA